MDSDTQRYTTMRHFFVFAQSSPDVSISSIIVRGLTLLTLSTQVLRRVFELQNDLDRKTSARSETNVQPLLVS